jgi:hypothetical protein
VFDFPRRREAARCAQGADAMLIALLGCIPRGNDHGAERFVSTTFLAQIGQSASVAPEVLEARG